MSNYKYIRPGERFHLNLWASCQPEYIKGNAFISTHELDTICMWVNEGRSIQAFRLPREDVYSHPLPEIIKIAQDYLTTE